MKSFPDSSGKIESYEHHRSWVEPRVQFDDISCVYTVVYTISSNVS